MLEQILLRLKSHIALVTSYSCDTFLHKEKPVELRLPDGHCHLVFVGYHLQIEMYYKFSGFTQRLTGAASSTAYSPQGLRANVPSESPAMIFGTPTKLVSESSATVEYMGKNRVPDLQRIFQASDNIPVHLKRGVPDRLLYRSTMALTVGGVLYCLVALYLAAQPKKK